MITKKTPMAKAALTMVAPVMEMVLMRPVGPDNHMSCMKND
jgi:hypothetical protein